jgi:hypothetical protein
MKRLLNVLMLATILTGLVFGQGSPATGTAMLTLADDSLPNIRAEQFAGADASCKIAAAIIALPSEGGTVDARSLSDVGGAGLCTIDPGTKSVTILAGPYTYHIIQIVLRTNFHFIGSGSGTGFGGTTRLPTLIQAMGSNSIPPIVLTTAAEGQEHVILKGFRIVGATGNTSQNGIVVNATGLKGGLWYSEFDDIEIANFGGIGLDIESPVGGGITQFSTFDRVRVFRVAGGGYGLVVKGWNSSLIFRNCEFDGTPQVSGGDGTTSNILIDAFGGGIFPPYNIEFDLLTTQWSPQAMRINAGDTLSISQGHFEGDYNAITLGSAASFSPLGITVHDSWFGNGTGVNGGAGSIVNNLASTQNVSMQFTNSHVYAAPDVFFKGNTGSIYQCGNTVGPEGSYTYIPCSNKNVGTIALSTGSIAAHSCTAAQTAAVSGVTTSSALAWNFTSTPIGVTGYGDNTGPFLVVTVFPTANTVNAVVCNTSARVIKPGVISIRISAWNTAP